MPFCYNIIMRRQELATAWQRNWGLTLALLFLFGASGFFGLREFWRWHSLNADFKNANREIIQNTAAAEKFKQELADLGDPAFLEKEARTRLNLKKEGESVFIVVGENDFPPEDFLAAPARGEFDKTYNFWVNLKEWRQYFFP